MPEQARNGRRQSMGRLELQERLRFLAEASDILASSLDYHVTLNTVAQLAIPLLGDGCIVNLINEHGDFQRVAVTHTNPEKQALAIQLIDRFPTNPEAPHGPAAALRTLETKFYPEITDEMHQATIRHPEQLEIVRKLGIRASIVVPLVTNNRVLGTISFVRTEPEGDYVLSDVSLAEAVARRAAVAVENALLHRQLEQAVAQQAESLALLDTLFTSTPLALAFLDRELRFVRVNSALAAINGIPAAEHLGRRLDELPSQRLAGLTPLLRTVLETGEPVSGWEVSDHAPNGPAQRGSWLLNAYPVRTVDQVIIGLGLALADISGRKRAEEHAQLLAEAGEVLGASLDYAETVQALTRIGVPRFADVCLVHLVDECGKLERVCVAQRDEEQPTQAACLTVQGAHHYMLPPVVAMVLQERRAGHWPVLSAADWEQIAGDIAPLARLPREFPAAAISVPLVARGRSLGVVTWIASDAGRHYGADEVALARELAQRGAVAIDHARLHQATERAIERVSALSAVARAFVAARLDLGRLLDTVTQSAAELIGDGCLVQLLDTAEEFFDDAAEITVYHPNPQRQEAARALFQAATEEQLACLFAPHGALSTPLRRQPIDPEQCRQILGPEFGATVEALQAHALLVVPLQVPERQLGRLILWREHASQPYSADDQRFAQELADHASLALVNARLYREAQALIRAREDFLSTASHELRTPLTTVKGYGQLLTRFLRQPTLDRERLMRLATRLGDQTSRFEALINDLLDVSRIQQGHLVLRRQRTDLTERATMILRQFELSPERTPAHRLVLDAPGPIEGHWDQLRLDQVMTNLISNALRYSPQGGEVRVTLRVHDEMAEIAVRDDGIGIALEEQVHLFQPFARSSRGQQIGGSGLGLYIARQIVEQHGGTIGVRSAPGVGSTFIVRLPLALPTTPEPQPAK